MDDIYGKRQYAAMAPSWASEIACDQRNQIGLVNSNSRCNATNNDLRLVPEFN